MDVGEGSTDLFEDENTTKNSAPIGHKRSRDLNSEGAGPSQDKSRL